MITCDQINSLSPLLSEISKKEGLIFGLDPSALAAFITILVSIGLFIIETRRSRAAHQVQTALDFYNQFHNAEFLTKRKTASTFLKDECTKKSNKRTKATDQQWEKVDDILDFFQIVGTFSKYGHVDIKILHNFFTTGLAITGLHAVPILRSVKMNLRSFGEMPNGCMANCAYMTLSIIIRRVEPIAIPTKPNLIHSSDRNFNPGFSTASTPARY